MMISICERLDQQHVSLKGCVGTLNGRGEVEGY